MIDLSEKVKGARSELGYVLYVRRPNTTNMKDVSGEMRGTLVVLEPTGERSGNHIKWACFCRNCGKYILVPGSRLRGNSHQKSCGCMTSRIISESMSRHGMTDTPTWKSWKSMHDRCYLKSHKSYNDYGGRGIFPCDEWAVFENFLKDMGERPAGTTLGRIDNGLGYSAENCRWETIKQQMRNRRSSHFLDAFGERKTISEWGEIFGIEHDVISRRLAKGWPVQDAIARPKKKMKNSRPPLKQMGHQIERRMVEVPTRDGRKARVAEYFLDGAA